jgi:hypothetical protein
VAVPRAPRLRSPRCRGAAATDTQHVQRHELGSAAPARRTEERRRHIYLDSISTVVMDSWNRGRVTLVGDAGYSPGPAVGGGTSLAVVGAYVLASELAAPSGDYIRGLCGVRAGAATGRLSKPAHRPGRDEGAHSAFPHATLGNSTSYPPPPSAARSSSSATHLLRRRPGSHAGRSETARPNHALRCQHQPSRTTTGSQ